MRKTSDITVTDQFCGAGGSSQGAQAAGARVVLAMNHWKLAVETHNTNFPEVLHDCVDISACNPRRYPRTDILITSPECTAHSLARGQKRKQQAQLPLWEIPTIDPAAERSRATMLDVPRFAEYHQYELIIVENVVEAREWILFDEWLLMMQKLGYTWEIVYFNSMFAHPTPQSRDRMYVVFWKKGNTAPDLRFTPTAWCSHCDKDIASVQSWKNPLKHSGRYNKQYVYCCSHCAGVVVPYYYAAANAINWSLPIQRIDERTKPLKPKTVRRIQIGLDRFAAAPVLIEVVHGSAIGGVVVPYLLDHLWEYRPRSVTDPLSTVVAGGNHHGLILSPKIPTSFLVSYYGRDAVHPLIGPMGTLTTLDRHALVAPPAEGPHVENCFFRMLQPSELGRAMAFPETYVVLGTHRERVKLYGNAVTPPVMRMILERCIATFQ